jgi:hypothetical protein
VREHETSTRAVRTVRAERMGNGHGDARRATQASACLLYNSAYGVADDRERALSSEEVICWLYARNSKSNVTADTPSRPMFVSKNE